MKGKRRIVASARRLARFCVVSGQLDESRVRRVVGAAVASKRRGTPAMLKQFYRLIRLDRERHTALVESATPLSEQARGDIAAGVTARHGAGMTTTFAANPDLIGGVRVKVGSDVYDGSVRGRLQAIEAAL
jgi:F-type H+-transporting ATPase subunit delta